MLSEVTRIQGGGGSISEVHPKNDVQGLKSEESEHHKLEASMGYESLSLKTKQIIQTNISSVRHWLMVLSPCQRPLGTLGNDKFQNILSRKMRQNTKERFY